MKICNIIGTRPQVIKYAMMEKEMRNHRNVLIHTGQHYDEKLFKIFFDEFKIKHPDYNIGIGSGNYGWQVGELIKRLFDAIKEEKPDVVLVYGDCNSTYAGAVAANLHHIPLAHVEAGLRCFDWKMIEEFNRVQTDHCSRFCFAPTHSAMNFLKHEGLGGRSYLVGNLHYDSFLFHQYHFNSSNILDEVGVEKNRYYLATVHRAETLGDPEKLKSVFSAFNQLDYPVLLSVHPHLKKVLHGLNVSFKNIRLCAALGYFDMQKLLSDCRMILTDSGGLTVESYFHKKQSIVLRDIYEYQDISGSLSQVVGTDTQKILNAMENEMEQTTCNPVFGEGKASGKIMDILEKEL